VVNSTVIAVSTTAGVVTLGLMTSFILARYQFRGRGAMYSLFAAGLMFPLTVAVTPLYILVKTIGLMNTLPGVILPQIGFAIPTTIIPPGPATFSAFGMLMADVVNDFGQTAIMPLEEAQVRLTRAVHLRLNTIGSDEGMLTSVQKLVTLSPGDASVYLHLVTLHHGEAVLEASQAMKVKPTRELVTQLRALLGDESVTLADRAFVPA